MAKLGELPAFRAIKEIFAGRKPVAKVVAPREGSVPVQNAPEPEPPAPVVAKTPTTTPAPARAKAPAPPQAKAPAPPQAKAIAPGVPARPPQAPPIARRDLPWADVSNLRIGFTEAFSREVRYDVGEPMTEGSLAIIGLDFGTAFTKAVVRFAGRDYAVEWAGVARIDDKYLMPSCFSEHDELGVVLGSKRSPGWKTRDGIKMAVFDPTEPSPEAIGTAILFLAQAIRHVQAWTRANVPGARAIGIRWRVHLGLPSAHMSGQLAERFEALGKRAFHAAMSPGPLRRRQLAAIDGRLPGVSVLPELLALTASYHRSNARQSDLHAIVDVGAATLDCAVFLDHENAAGDLVAVLAAKVDRLGTHYFLSALAGAGAEGQPWHDADVALTDAGVSQRTGGSFEDVELRRKAYRGKFKGAFDAAWTEAYGHYNRGPVILGQRPLRVFLSGGGGRLNDVILAIRQLEAQFRTVRRIQGFNVTAVPAPARGAIVYDGGSYDRMAVAHGLCNTRENLGNVTWCEAPADRHAAPEIRDRDDDR